ncbi:MAG: acyl-CoA dehydrogenase C-terminal domain-containing protein [Gammaproteobacteria bacterium]
MNTYRPPLKDMQFVLDELVDFESLRTVPQFSELDSDLVGSLLEEAGKLAVEAVAPCYNDGDSVGAQIHDGNVTAAPGFKEAYEAFVEGGWPSISFNPDFGGQGLPSLLSFSVDEMLNSANMAFALCPMLTQACVESLDKHGSESLKQTYLGNLISGTWTGAMDLTEPQAGSNLAAIRASAKPRDDHFLLSGTKIYISWGDHGMAENVLHMVLARLPDAPPGVKGISLFLVPKYLVNDDGSLGARNDFRPISIEHKMGIHGSPTCVMEFGADEGAVGYMVGAPNEGLKCMFTMMNNARLKVGLEGLGIAEKAYQHARRYAFDRIQGRPPGGTDKSPIAGHPDVRRMLMLQKSVSEAMRVMCYTAGADTDRSEHLADAVQREAYEARVALMVPMVKAWCTELCQEMASIGIQIHGGMGFIEETGAAPIYRDARITTIYEGTTGIQAQDLAGRKIIRDNGKAVTALMADIQTTVVALTKAGMSTQAQQLGQGNDVMKTAVEWLLENYADDQFAPNAVCYNLLMACSTVVAAWGMARSMLAAKARLDGGDSDTVFLNGKLVTARFFLDNVLPRAGAFAQAVTAGSTNIMGLSDEQF